MVGTEPKVFGIGLSKTGTSSLAQALQILGFKTLDNMGASRYVAGDLSSIEMQTIEAHEALTDTPIPSFYRELDARFPNSKFILTVRDREGWSKSCMKQFSRRFAEGQSESNKRLFEDLYGTNVFDAAKFASGYDRFVAGVGEHFKDRPADLLMLDVAAGEGWEKLCPFLGKPVPDTPFPKANVTQIRWMRMEDLVTVAEEAGAALLQRYEGDLAPAAQGRSGPAAGRRLLNRAMQAALGRDATEAAIKAAHKLVVSGLKRLNPDIAVISSADEPAPYAERKRWNHVWLVDPLDGRDAFINGRSNFSVNIALIEDGRPIYGVVHAPAMGVTYYGRAGKGGYKHVAQAEPLRLAMPGTTAPALSTRDSGDGASDTGNLALLVCALLEAWPEGSPHIRSAMEWQVAAAHAVLGAAGARICDSELELEFVYNKGSLSTARGVARG
jgi:3'-phosphoadenosine 5'-phosphosulfate (PAPS) 3'-phosphatase